jgi:hypothetical protein
MTHKSINETELQNMRRKGSDTSEIVDSSRYTHKYFVEVDITNTFVQDYLIFTVRVNFLPRKPVYIDIINLKELISSMTRTLRNSETIKFKNELLDLLHHYEKNS